MVTNKLNEPTRESIFLPTIFCPPPPFYLHFSTHPIGLVHTRISGLAHPLAVPSFSNVPILFFAQLTERWIERTPPRNTGQRGLRHDSGEFVMAREGAPFALPFTLSPPSSVSISTPSTSNRFSHMCQGQSNEKPNQKCGCVQVPKRINHSLESLFHICHAFLLSADQILSD